MAAMDEDQFAREFAQLYRELYRLAVRRVHDGREQLSAETVALLLHLAQAGPSTLSELTRHFSRAMSTLSAKVAHLETQGLLARQADVEDARCTLIWLSPAGRQALLQALEVLDTGALAAAAAAMDVPQRAQLLEGMSALVSALPQVTPQERRLMP